MIKVEETEIKTWEKHVHSTSECTVKKGVFTCLRTETVSFHSDVYKYEKLSVVINREISFGEHYYSFAVYDDVADKAWPLVSVQAKLDIYLKRLGKNCFVLWTDSPGDETNIKQCSFFVLNDNEKTNSISVDYHSLKSVHLMGDRVLLAYSQKVGGVGGLDEKRINTLALYENTGKLVKTFYEFSDTDSQHYNFVFNENTNMLAVLKGKAKAKDGKKTVVTGDMKKDVYDLSSISGDAESARVSRTRHPDSVKVNLNPRSKSAGTGKTGVRKVTHKPKVKVAVNTEEPGVPVKLEKPEELGKSEESVRSEESKVPEKTEADEVRETADDAKKSEMPAEVSEKKPEMPKEPDGAGEAVPENTQKTEAANVPKAEDSEAPKVPGTAEASKVIDAAEKTESTESAKAEAPDGGAGNSEKPAESGA